MVSKNTKSSDKQNVELFKFFEKTKQRKTSKTSPKSKKDPKPMMFKLPQRRTTRLKSEIFVENYPEFLPDGEYDISKEDFDNSDLILEPIKKKIKLSDIDDNSNPQMLNIEQCDALNATLKNTESPLETTMKHSDIEKSEKRKQSINPQTSEIQKMADNFLETIDTNAIAEMLKDTTLDKADCEEKVLKKMKVSKKKRKGTQPENSEQLIESTQSDSGLQSENNVTKPSKINEQFKKRGGNSDFEDNEKSAEVTKKSKKKKRKSLQTNADLENGLFDNNPQLSLTISEDDGDTENFSKNKDFKYLNMEKEESRQEFKKSKSKKKKRKLNLENSDNNPESSIILSDNDDDMEKSSKISLRANSNIEVFKDSNIESKEYTQESKKSKKKKRNLNIENSDNNPELSLIVSDNDDNLEISPNISLLANKYNTNSNVEKLNDSNVEKEHSAEETNHSNSNLTNNIDLENYDNNLERSVNSVEPKKRGRKPKTLNNYDDNNLENSANSLQPKKRGRKPKTLNNSLKDKNTSPITNGILKYFSVKDKKLEENVQSKNLPNENSEPPLDNTINDNNTQVSLTENSASNPDQSTTRSRRSNNLNTTDASLVKPKLNKTGNTEEEHRQRGKARVIKVNVAKEINKKKNYKISKMTKDQIKKSSSRKIPKNRLEEVLEMIEDEDHSMWEDRNISCNPCIHTYWESRQIKLSDQNMKLKFARQFLLRRDWTNLSKILCLYNSEAKMYYPLLSKYAALLLAHTDNEQFDKFIQFLTSITDSSAVIKKCTKISKDNEE